MLEFAVLGPLEVRVDGAVRQRALLSTLLCRPDQVIAASVLAEAACGGPGRLSNLQVYVHRLRRSLVDPASLEFRPPGYRLVLATASTDVQRFRAIAEQAQAAMAEAHPRRAAELYDEALACWRGEPFADVDGGPMVEAERDRLQQLRADVSEARVEALLAAGRLTEAARDAAELAGVHPFRERVHLTRLEALRRSGRRAEALTAYGQIADLFQAELGVAPGDALRNLRRQIGSDGVAVSPDEAVGTPRSVLVARAQSLMSRGEHGAAIAVARQAAAHELIGVCLREQGRLNQAYGQLTLALTDAVANDGASGEARAMQLLAIVERERGRPAQASRLLDRADGIHRELGDRTHQACMPLSRAELGLRAGAPDALGLAERGIEMCQDMGLDFGVAYGARLLGQAALEDRRPADALRWLTTSARLSRSGGAPFAFAVTLFNLGRAHATLGHTNDALRTWRRAGALFGRIGHVEARHRVGRHIESLT